MTENRPTRVETPQAQSAKLRYYDLGDKRTLSQLAEMMRQEQEATYAANQALGLRGKALGRVQTQATIERRLKEWSRTWGWQEYCADADKAKAEAARRDREEKYQRLNDDQATWGKTISVRGSLHIDTLLKADQALFDEYAQRYAVAKALFAKCMERGDEEAAANVLWPSRPKPFYTAHSLNELVALGLEVGRLASTEGLLNSQRTTEANLPDVHVSLEGAPPPEPVDPLEEQLQDSAADDGAPDSAIPPALVRLSTQPPRIPDEDDDGWGDEADDDE
jgi:hypothetical protein